jgi:hypothetical protein
LASRPRPSSEEEPAGETGPEVAGDRESGEYSGDGGGLERGEDEDEGGIPERVVEVPDAGELREAAGEGNQDEQRRDDRRQQERGAREHPADGPPGDGTGDVSESFHARTSLFFIAALAAARLAAAIAAAIPNPRASARASQPVMMRLRRPSTR